MALILLACLWADCDLRLLLRDPMVDITQLQKTLRFRPVGWINQLPVKYRWEFTKRHPYYLTFWKLVHLNHSNQLQGEVQQLLGRIATLVLLNIGVSGDPPPPDAGEEALQTRQIGKAYLAGAVAPMTYRAMAGMMMKDCSKPTLIKLANYLAYQAGCESSELHLDHMAKLMKDDDSELDRIPNRPILGINLEAPQRAIVEAVNQQVKQWKNEQGIKERRRRAEKLPAYLKVWDQREGWAGDRYDIKKERSFVDIARKTGQKQSTVVNQYLSAFKLISGHEYSFENWARLFIVEKMYDLQAQSALRRRVVERREKGMSVTPIPAGFVDRVTKDEDGRPDRSGLMANVADKIDHIDDADTIMDIECMIEKGCCNDEIAKKLEIPLDQIDDLVDYVRGRVNEGPQPAKQSRTA